MMSIKNQNKIFSKYPLIMSRIKDDIESGLQPYGIYCGDGWFDIIDDLCADLKIIIEDSKIEDVCAVQIKIKFGSMRFYLNKVNPRISDRIGNAEKLSYKVCSKCGECKEVHRSSFCSKCRYS